MAVGRPGAGRTSARRALAGVGAAAGVLGAASVGAQAVDVTPHSVFDLPAEVTALAFSSGGDRALAGDAEGNIVVRDLPEGTSFLTDGPGGPVVFASFLAGDTTVVTVDGTGRILVRPVTPGGEEVRLATEDEPERVALDAGRRTLAVATRGARIEVYDLPTRQRIGVIDARGEVDDVLFLGFDRHGRQLVAVSRSGDITAWNPASLEPLRRVTLQSSEIHGSRSVVHGVGADRSANILVAALEEVALPRGGVRGRARPGDLVRRFQLFVFDWYSGAEIRRLPFPDGVVEALAVGPGNDHVVVARGDRVTVLDLRRGERGAGITAPAAVSRLTVSPGQELLGIGSREGHVAVWELAYRDPPVAEALDAPPEGVGGRLRVLGEESPAVPADAPVTVAVLPFDDRDGDGRMSRTVAELLTTQLANLGHLTVVERLRIDALLDEHDLQRQGVTEAGGLELGRMLNADYVLLGSIGASGTTFTFSARLLDVETTEVVSGRQVLCEECRAQDLFEAVHLLGTTIAR